jgi:hypothetical protein
MSTLKINNEANKNTKEHQNTRLPRPNGVQPGGGNTETQKKINHKEHEENLHKGPLDFEQTNSRTFEQLK